MLQNAVPLSDCYCMLLKHSSAVSLSRFHVRAQLMYCANIKLHMCIFVTVMFQYHSSVGRL